VINKKKTVENTIWTYFINPNVYVESDQTKNDSDKWTMFYKELIYVPNLYKISSFWWMLLTTKFYGVDIDTKSGGISIYNNGNGEFQLIYF
jgi:hypothetical protein